MGRKARVTTMKTSPLTLALFIPIILVSAGSRPKKYRTSDPVAHLRSMMGIWRCPMDVYSLWIYDIIDYRMDYELKVGSLSSFGSFKYQRNGTFTVEDQTMSWLVKKYQDIVNLEVEILDSKNDCRKLIITYKDGSTSKMVYLGPIPDGPVTTTTTTTTTTKGTGPDVYPPNSYDGRRRKG